MPLGPGTRLGPYEIIAPLGAGGMGEVYRARDTRLHRDVAIKILPEAFGADAERLARFAREAQTLAALNHQNIAQIHGLEESPGGRALVMEFVEGDDLSAIIARGPIPIAEALPIVRQIAAALEAAHDAGIVHRDLKPANIKVKSDGTVKVLDFGLAKAMLADAGTGAAMNAATMTSPAITQHGVILGTAAYMSPEQARGRPVDKRADLWAFGAVLYEMLTGRLLFSGETVTDVLAAVVTREPDWSLLPAGTPVPIRRLLQRCLEKDPARRRRDATDLRLDIDEALTAPAAESGATSAVTSAPSRVWMWRGLAAAALLVGVAIGLFAHHASPAAESSPRILNLTLPSASASTVAISPDGRWIALISEQKVFVKGLAEFAWRELGGTTGARTPLIWSPDSRRLAFPVDSGLKKTDLVGSRPHVICDRCVQPDSLRGGSWNRDGILLLGGSPEDRRLSGGLLTISENGGAMTRVTALDASRGENSHRYPIFLPDGRRFVFTIRRDNGEHEIRVGDLSGSPTRVIVSGFAKTAYANGRLLFVRDGTLLALPFDPATATASGDPVKIAESVSESLGTGLSSFDVATDGTLVFGPAAETRGYAFFDRSGRKLNDVTSGQADGGGRVTRDGQLVVVAEIDPAKASTDIWVTNLVTNARTRLTSDPNWEQQPVWSPDGRRVAYLARTNGQPSICVQDAIGGNEHRVNSETPTGVLALDDWSPDGTLLLASLSTTAGEDLLKLRLADGKFEKWMPSIAGEGAARFSPDGRWVAYMSGETGSRELFVRSFPDARIAHRVTTAGGQAPLWSRDGNELFYIDGERWIVAVRVHATSTSVDTGPPQRLFKPTLGNVWGAGYQHDVDARGRFFAYRVGDETGSYGKSLTVLLNWPGMLPR